MPAISPAICGRWGRPRCSARPSASRSPSPRWRPAAARAPGTSRPPSRGRPRPRRCPGRRAHRRATTAIARRPDRRSRRPSRGPEHAVYSLVDNRLSAHLTRGGGLVVAAGSAGFAKYVRFANLMKGGKKPWELRQTEGEVKVARMTGKSGTVFVPLTAAQAGQRQGPAARVRRVRRPRSASGSTTTRTSTRNSPRAGRPSSSTVPAGQLKDGENALQLFMKAPGVELAWLQVGGGAGRRRRRHGVLRSGASSALVLPEGGADDLVRGGARQGAADRRSRPTAAARSACSPPPRTAPPSTASSPAPARRSTCRRSPARRRGSISTGTGCAVTALSNAALVGAGRRRRRSSAASRPSYVVFIVMDSLRADRVRPFNPKARPETPNFDKLAESSTLFISELRPGQRVAGLARVDVDLELPRQAQGDRDVRPPARQVGDDRRGRQARPASSSPARRATATSARRAASARAGTGSSNHIEKGLGLKGGDDHGPGPVVHHAQEGPAVVPLPRPDRHPRDLARQAAVDRQATTAATRAGSRPSSATTARPGSRKDLTEHEKDHVRALYDSNVSYQDDLIGQLVEKLQGWGVWDKTMLIVTADHGDEQWEDGRVGHGGSERETPDPRAAGGPLPADVPRGHGSPRAPRASTSCRPSPTCSASRPTPSGRACRWSGSPTAPAATR